MNFRAFDILTGESFHWNSAGTVPGGGRGRSLPAAGTGVFSLEGVEIFHGDIVKKGGYLYLVKFRKGGFWLEFLEGDAGQEKGERGEEEGHWLHEFVEEASETEISIVGSTRSNSSWLVGVLLRRAAGGGGGSVDKALGEERGLAKRAGGGDTELPKQ